MSTATNGSTTAIDPDPSSFPHIPVVNTLGAWLVAIAATFLLNGLLLHQTYWYFRKYRDDPRYLKIWVIIVVILQTFLSVLLVHTMWFYLVQLYWYPTQFFVQKTVWSINVLPVVASATALCSQMFFIWRLWLLGPKFKIIAAMVFILNVGNVACFTALTFKCFAAPPLYSSSGFTSNMKFSYHAPVAVAVQMAGDIVLTLALIYVFRKSRTGIDKTDSMFELLIAYAIGTGAVNCVGHLLTLAFSIAYPRNWIYGFFSCVDTKLYAIGFLVVLDSRKFIFMTRFSNQLSRPHAFTEWNLEFSSPRSGMAVSNVASVPTAIELNVATEDIVEDDSEGPSKHGTVHGVVRRHLPLSSQSTPSPTLSHATSA